MRSLPSGTVTFLFTDIEGSTRLLRELGADRYADELAEHRRLLRGAFEARGGVEVDTQGDAFFYAFATAPEAVAAARDGQAALAGGTVRVRMGLHTGNPHETAAGYVGEDVHLGARVASAGHGGQVVLSKATYDLLDGVSAHDLGEHRVKDFDEPVWIYQLSDEPFPPLKTISNTNLPRPASSFVGREREVEEVAALLREARLLTLTGPGGSGKTRLSIEAGAEVVGEFKNGVFWVPLATVQNPAGVLPALAQTLGAQVDLVTHIGERELLLLLDNLEQVVDAAPELATLVEACPNLRLLVTSRELLRVRGEVGYEVLPLDEPDAIELFCLRSGLEASPETEELCHRLDNMPLALELAAARTRALTPAQIVERLDRRLDLFRAGRDAEDRQRTLRATIEWSHDLLMPDEQRLFASLGVFAGGCTLHAAEAVCGADLDTVQSLVEKSLLRHTDDRFWMLETIREFAVERLDASDEAALIRDRYARFFLALAQSANMNTEGFEHAPSRLDVVLLEQANLRDAIDRSLEAGDNELAAELVHALELLWVIQDPVEGMRRTRAVLDAGPLPPRLQARIVRGFGSSADPAGEYEAAERAYEESIGLFRQVGDEAAVAHMLMRLGSSALKRGDYDAARSLLEESLAACQRTGSRVTEGQVYGILGWLEAADGNPEFALTLYERSAAQAREADFTWWEVNMVDGLAETTFALGRFDDAERWAFKMVELASRIGNRQGRTGGLVRLATTAAATGRQRRAGVLWGAFESEEASGPGAGWAYQREACEQLLPLGDEEFERGRAQGRLLSFDQALEYAHTDA